MTHNARKIKMAFELSPGVKDCSDVVKGKLFSPVAALHQHHKV